MFNKTVKSANVCAKNAAEEFEGVASQYGRKARKLLESAQDEFGEVSEAVSKEISANPWRSGLVALGLGVLIGALITRAE